MSNPDNFNDHRLALIRLSLIVPVAGRGIRSDARPQICGPRRAASARLVHRRSDAHESESAICAGHSWQVHGRGTGIIDTLHLVEVARAASRLDLSARDLDGVKKWFAEYLEWMNTHPYGITERDAKNNHGTCWVTQVAAFARLTGNATLTEYCRDRFKTVLIPNQEAADGSFPLELARTKPYGYSLFNLDAMSILAQTLTTREDNLWTWQLPDGRGMARAVAYMSPYIADKKKWPKPPDVMYYKEWPVRQPSLLFAGLALGKTEYLDLWKRLDADPTVDEVVRNWPVRQPVLWVE